MNRKNSVYRHVGPIKDWHQGLMLGNGNFGALIFGDKKLTFSLDLISLWDNRLTSEMKEKGFTYQNMIYTMKNDWSEYIRLFDNCYNHPYPTKINAGSVIFDVEVTRQTAFQIDVRAGEFKIENNGNLITGFLHANTNVLVVNSREKLGFSFKMPEYLYKEIDGLGYEQPEEKTDGEYRYIIQKTKCGFDYCNLIKEVKSSEGFVYLITSFKITDSNQLQNYKELLADFLRNLEVLKKEHCLYWKKYYRQSEVVTGDNKLDKLYNFSRYFFACNSKGDYPMSLEGVWTRNDGNLPPWKGDYHLDINLEMSYESYMKTGNFNEGKVLVDYLWNNRNQFKKLAKTFANSEGYFIPGVMTQNCQPLGGWPMYALNPCQGIWISTAFDNYYRYTGKLSFLKNRAYPFLKNLEMCISSLSVKDKDGYLKFEFSASPEINDCNKDSIFETQTNFELAMLHYLYRTLISYCNILGIDSKEYMKKQSLLRDYIRNENGEMVIANGLNYQVSHRHFSHLLMHKNLENLDPYNNFNQIEKDLNRLENYGHDEWVGFSFVEASSLASYIMKGNEAYKYLFAFADGFVNKNGFHMNMDFNHKGYSKIHSYAFTLEANMGYVRALTDMMLRTTDGIITVFPAIHDNFKENGCYFKNLRTFNNNKVSAKFEDNQFTFNIKLSKPSTLKLYNNIAEHFVLNVDGEEKQFDANVGEIIEVEANKVVSYLGNK